MESVGGNEAVGGSSLKAWTQLGRLVSNLKPFDDTLKRIGSELVGSALKNVGNALMLGSFASSILREQTLEMWRKTKTT